LSSENGSELTDTRPAPGERHAAGKRPKGKYLAVLSLAALGVVYGDIGTSPLYAVRECFSPESPHHVPVTVENVPGVLSLVFWALVVVVIPVTIWVAATGWVEDLSAFALHLSLFAVGLLLPVRLARTVRSMTPVPDDHPSRDWAGART